MAIEPLRRLAAALVAATLFVVGCEHDQPPDTVRQVVGIAEVPEGVLAAAKTALPDVKFEDAWKNVNRSTKALHSYEVRGRNPRGKIREVRVSTDGTVLEME